MSDLIHKIVGKIIEVGQSDTTKFRLGETIRYSPSEILEILKQHESEIFGEGSSTQTNAFNTLNALELIDREATIEELARRDTTDGTVKVFSGKEVISILKEMPSAQPEIAENLYMYKCYITDKDGLQHEVIHTDDIRRVTGWKI